MPTKSRKSGLTAGAIVLVAAVAIAAIVVVKHFGPVLTGSGCQAGSGQSAVSLEPEQAAIAATIAGVANDQAMPSRAVSVAYATAMQESHLHNFGYGDRDSVGVFQQRPSEGWGPASKLRDPVFATSQFFQALSAVPGYRQLPVYRAAQAVQHSADGHAYIQYQPIANKLTAAFTGLRPHAVWCWSARADPKQAHLVTARRELERTYGALGARLVSVPKDAPAIEVPAGDPDLSWSVAAWLVTHAAKYQIREVHYAGFRWRAASG
ncbi:MAG TPA: hypothetical protein VIV12_31550, partial [Streptosporangiaceae bacterium]